MNVKETPQELEPMSGAVRGMLGRSLGALIFRNIVLAGEVLESDDVVDRYRDQIFLSHLLAGMIREPFEAAPHLQFRAGDAISRAHCGSCHQYRRGHYFLGAWFGRAPRARAIQCGRVNYPKSGPERGGILRLELKISSL